MPAGQLHIKTRDIDWKDAYTEWGLSLDQSSLSALMTPAPNKAYIENSSRLEHGKKVINNIPKVDSRSVTLAFNLTAKDENEFLRRYAKICEEILAKGYIELKTEFQEGVVYRMYYESCTQFSQFMRSIGKFSLKLSEPDPTNRS